MAAVQLESSTRQLIVDAIRRELAGVSVIYLFGSYAKGEAGESSDIDLAVLGKGHYGNVQLWELAQQLSVKCGRDVDLVDLRQSTAVMRIQIVAEGEHLFDDHDPDSILFEDFVYSDYARLNEERREILDDIAARGSVHG